MAATPEHAARVLGLSVDATLEEVRVVRRALAMKYHPDCTQNPERASRHMARINAAVDTLVAHIKLRRVLRSQRSKAAKQQARARTRAAQRPASDGRVNAKPGAGQQETRARRETKRSREQVRSKPVDATPARATLCVKDTAGPDVTLIRLAAASYRKVLEQISQIETAPTVDVMALSYPAA